MGNIIKELREKGLVIDRPFILHEFLELDLNDPNDREEYKKYKLLYQLRDYMLDHKISKADLAKKMGITRQAVMNRFIGRSLTLDWLSRASAALGLDLDIQIAKGKKHSHPRFKHHAETTNP